MTTVKQNTITNTLPLYIRDVLRNNLNDPTNANRDGREWIMKGKTETKINTPSVFLEETTSGEDAKNLNYTRFKQDETITVIRVWADSMKNRDDLIDEIKKTFRNPNSSDGSTTLEEQQLHYKGTETENGSELVNERNQELTIKRYGVLRTRWAYSGS